MKAFELPDFTSLKLIKPTPRKEHHGDALVQAITLRVLWETTNATLDKLHPGLLDMLYFSQAAESGQENVEGVPAVKPNLRCSWVKPPLKVDFEVTGYTVTIDYGTGGDANLELYGCTLDRFEIEPKEGGTVLISWNIASNEKVTPELVGILCGMEGDTITLMQKAPEVKKDAPVIDGSTEAFKKDYPDASAGGADATDLFLQQQREQQGAAGGDAGEGDPDEFDGDGAEDGEGSAPDAGEGVAPVKKARRRKAAA